MSHELKICLFLKLFSTQWIMAILSKACKPDSFESQDSLKLIFTNIQDLRSSFVEYESSLESNSHDILAPCKTILDDSIDSGHFSVKYYLPLIPKDSITHMRDVVDYVKQGLALDCTGLIFRKLSRFLFMFLTGFTSLSVLLLFPVLIILFIFIYA